MASQQGIPRPLRPSSTATGPPNGQKFAEGPTEGLTGIPSVTNGHRHGSASAPRPDRARPITSWADTESRPEFQGAKAPLAGQSETIGIIDVAMGRRGRAATSINYKKTRGNMTKEEEIDKNRRSHEWTFKERAGPFRSFWTVVRPVR